MKYGELNLGQIEALVNKLGGMEGVQRFLSGTVEVVVKSILKLFNGNVAFDAVDTHDPRFFQTHAGLWVSDEFRSRILSKAKPVKNLAAAVGKSYDLTQNAYDREIALELPEGYAFFDESEVCVRIEAMIQKQPKGEAGDLLNNGCANLFYVAGYVVSVYWYVGLREWNVNAWKLDDDDWGAGSRVFSRN